MLRQRRTSGLGAKLAALVILALSPGASPAGGGMASELRVDWEQRQGPLIGGYVYNDGGTAAAQVTVLAEGLDGAGQRVSATVGHVMGTILGFSRAYFEVRVPPAASYRVSVLSVDWIRGGGGM